MKSLPHTRSCFVCGESNPIGLNLRFETDGKIVRVRFVPRAEHVGFRQTIHGGLIATVLDELIVWACAVQTRQFAYCAELNVRFLRPLRPLEEVVGEAELTANRKMKIFEGRGELKDSTGLVMAAATGKYLPVKKMDVSEMAVDLVGESDWKF